MDIIGVHNHGSPLRVRSGRESATNLLVIAESLLREIPDLPDVLLNVRLPFLVLRGLLPAEAGTDGKRRAARDKYTG